MSHWYHALLSFVICQYYLLVNSKKQSIVPCRCNGLEPQYIMNKDKCLQSPGHPTLSEGVFLYFLGEQFPYAVGFKKSGLPK